MQCLEVWGFGGLEDPGFLEGCCGSPQGFIIFRKLAVWTCVCGFACGGHKNKIQCFWFGLLVDLHLYMA